MVQDEPLCGPGGQQGTQASVRGPVASVAAQGLGDPCRPVEGRVSPLLHGTHQVAFRIKPNFGTSSPREGLRKETKLSHKHGAALGQGPERWRELCPWR